MLNSKNTQRISRTRGDNINDLKAKHFQPSNYLQAKINEPATGWPIEEFLTPKEKKKI